MVVELPYHAGKERLPNVVNKSSLARRMPEIINLGGNAVVSNMAGSSEVGKKWGDVFTQRLTEMVDEQNEYSHGEWAKETDDPDAFQLFYQWVHGKGPDHWVFNEHSWMGQQMLKADYVKKAYQKFLSQVEQGNFEKMEFAKSLRKQSFAEQMRYLEEFFKEAIMGRNPAKAFHGSIGGSIRGEVQTITGKDGKKYLMIIPKISLKDQMSATSGTRMPPALGGYEKIPVGVFRFENPYGPKGKLRTIKIDYEMKMQPIIIPYLNEE